MKKVYSALLSLLLVLCLMGTVSAEAPADMPIVQEKINLTCYAVQSPQGGIANEAATWKRYEEMTNIHIDFVDVPQDTAPETLSTLLGSGELPDILLGFSISSNDMIKYGSAGLFADLTDVLDENAYYFNKVLEQYPGIRSGITLSDGRIYSIPHLKLGDNMRTNKLFINPQWLEACNLEMPETFAEFEEVLYAFREYDANGNGEADEIPFLIRYRDDYFWAVMKSFFGLGNRGTAHPWVDWDYEYETLRFIPTTEQFKDLLTVAHQWYVDGIFDPELFQDTSSKQIVAKAGIGLAGAHADFVTNTGSTYQEIFRCVPVLENYYGEKTWNRYTATINNLSGMVISAKCSYVDELVKWADYFYSDEGLILYNMGIEGLTFEYDDNRKPVWLDKMINDPEGRTLTQMRVQYMYIQAALGIYSDETYQGPETYWTSTELMDDYRQYLPEEVWEAFTPTLEEAEEMDYIWTDIEAYLKQNFAAFINGTRSLDEWDDYVATLESMNLDRYMELYNQQYERYAAAN